MQVSRTFKHSEDELTLVISSIEKVDGKKEYSESCYAALNRSEVKALIDELERSAEYWWGTNWREGTTRIDVWANEHDF